jgi:hypothetical protein
VIHWDFYDSQSGAGGAHLHFKVPAIGFLTHAKALQSHRVESPERGTCR